MRTESSSHSSILSSIGRQLLELIKREEAKMIAIILLVFALIVVSTAIGVILGSGIAGLMLGALIFGSGGIIYFKLKYAEQYNDYTLIDSQDTTPLPTGSTHAMMCDLQCAPHTDYRDTESLEVEDDETTSINLIEVVASSDSSTLSP